MNEPETPGLNEPSAHPSTGGDLRARPIGSPLPMGSHPAAENASHQAAPPGRALPGAMSIQSGVERAMGLLRQALPFVQKMLPMLEGNVATVVTNLITQPGALHHQPAQTHVAAVDLTPIEGSLTELQTQQRDLRSQLSEQNASIKRMEDQMEMVREATDRNTLEQQELIEDLKSVGNNVKLLAYFVVGLLLVSIALNIMLILHIQRVLP